MNDVISNELNEIMNIVMKTEFFTVRNWEERRNRHIFPF